MSDFDYKKLLKKVQEDTSTTQIEDDRFKLPQAEILYEGNTTVIKNFELKNVWWRFLVLTFFMFLVSAGFFVTKQHREARSIIKGTLNPIFSFPKIWKKRLSIQSKRFVRDSDMIKSGLIRNDFWSTIQDFKLKIKQMF